MAVDDTHGSDDKVAEGRAEGGRGKGEGLWGAGCCGARIERDVGVGLKTTVPMDGVGLLITCKLFK